MQNIYPTEIKSVEVVSVSVLPVLSPVPISNVLANVYQLSLCFDHLDSMVRQSVKASISTDHVCINVASPPDKLTEWSSQHQSIHFHVHQARSSQRNQSKTTKCLGSRNVKMLVNRNIHKNVLQSTNSSIDLTIYLGLTSAVIGSFTIVLTVPKLKKLLVIPEVSMHYLQ